MKQRIRNVVTLAEHCDQALVADAVKDDTKILRRALGFDFVLCVVGRRRVAAALPPTAERPGEDDQSGCDEDDVLEHD